MSDNVYFEGDPATDSARRHLERVLKEPERRRRRWPWVAASAAAALTWYFWPRERNEPRNEPPKGSAKARR